MIIATTWQHSRELDCGTNSFNRICEAGLNQNLTGEQVMKQQELAIQAALKLAEAELAKNQSELAKSLRDPAVRGLWKQLVEPSRKWQIISLLIKQKR